MAKAHKLTGINPKANYHTNARIILPQKVKEVYTWEEFIYDPDKAEQLHNMRISIKRLRYTMEFFVTNYGEQFTDFLITIIDLQDILGDIHDSDVQLETLTEYKNSNLPSILPGIESLIIRNKNARNSDYKKFLKKWEQLSKNQFKQRLLVIIAS